MTWRALVAAGVFLALIVAGMLLLRREDQPRVEPVPPRLPGKAPPLVVPPPPLARAELIDAAARAADAEARGVPVPPDVHQLAGRRFVLALPFGCRGPAPERAGAPFGYRYDAEAETLRVVVTPQVWTDAEFVRAIVGAVQFEAAEGFWITRPWIKVDACPRAAGRSADGAPSDTATPAESAEEPPAAADETERQTAPGTLGIVELFAPGSRRSSRRGGRSYELVERVSPGEIDLASGLRFVVEGRLERLANGSPIGCWSASPDRQPLCLIAARVDRFAVTDASGRNVLSEWRD